MKKRIASIILSLVMLLSLLPTTAFADTPSYAASGTGSLDDPYLISTKDQLTNLATAVNGGTNMSGVYFKLTADISGFSTPIGTSGKAFSGTFDGGGYTVTLSIISTPAAYAGLFGYVSGTVNNVITAGTVSSTNTNEESYIGGVCGYIAASGTILNCGNTAAVTGKSGNTGGVCGYIAGSGTVANSYNTGTVKNGTNVGGVCGSIAKNGKLTNCYSVKLSLTASNCGDVCGKNAGTITNCYGNSNDLIGGVTGEQTGSYQKAPSVVSLFCNNLNNYINPDIKPDTAGFYYWAFDSSINGGKPYIMTPWAQLGCALGGYTVQRSVDGLFTIDETATTITLQKDFTAASGETTLTVGGTKILDLNGHVINGAGLVGKVITVPSGANLTIKDGSEDKYTYFDYVKGGAWTLNTTADSTAKGDATDVSDITDETTAGALIEVPGGAITGGSGSSNGGVSVAGTLKMDEGNIVGNSATQYGGGVFISSDGNFELSGGAICGNAATDGGGGVTNQNGTFIMDGGTISYNTASAGGGVYNHHNDTSKTAPAFTMKKGTIANNSANQGGGVNVTGGTFTMEDGSIENNSASVAGGGVYAKGVTGKNTFFIMNGGTIAKNNCAGDTGGGGVDISSSAYLYMGGGSIENNTASNGNGAGGIHTSTTVTIGGTAQVTGNTKNGTASNLSVPNSGLTLGTGSADVLGHTVPVPANDMMVGVLGQGDNGLIAKCAASQGYDKYFSSDNPQYCVVSGTHNTIEGLIYQSCPKVTVSALSNGTVTADPTSAKAGTTVTLTVAPDAGYALKADNLKAYYWVSQTKAEYLTLAQDENDETKYTFEMPAYDVTVTATFEVEIHKHDEITFTAWTDALAVTQNGSGMTAANSLPAAPGSYYLTQDVTLERNWGWNVPNSGEIDLCLNGHVVQQTKDSYIYYIYTNATLNLYDCGKKKHDGYLDSNSLWHWDKDGDHELVSGETEYDITGGILTGGKSSSGGGCVRLDSSSNSTFTMHGGTLAGNMTTKGPGGAVYGNKSDCTIVIENARLVGNVATGNGGGAVAIWGDDASGKVTIKNSEMSHNKVNGYSGGGALYLRAKVGGQVQLTISDSKISDNSAPYQGGGISVERCIAEITDSEISGNTAVSGDGDGGGGIANYDSDVTLKRCKITGNHADGSWGGGIRNGSSSSGSSSTTLIDCEVSGNTAKNVGGVANWKSLVLGGKTVIRNNKNTGGALKDLYVRSQNGATATIGDGTNGVPALKTGSFIGVCYETGSYGPITTNGTKGDVKYFTSEYDGHYIDYDDTNKYLVFKETTGLNAVTVNQAEHGVVYVSPQAAESGDITVEIIPDNGYELEMLSVGGTAVSPLPTQKDDDSYTHTFTITADTTVAVTFKEAGPAIRVTKAKDGSTEVANPVYGTPKEGYKLFNVTAKNFASTPSLTLQWKKVDGQTVTWDGDKPTGVTLGTDGTISTSANTPAGSYVFRIITGTEGQAGFVASGEITLTVEKLSYTGVTTTADGNLKAKANSTVDIELPPKPDNTSYGTPVVAVGLSSNVSASIQDTNKLHLSVDTALPVGTEAFTVTVPVTPLDTNHSGYDITVTVTPVFKTEVTVSATGENFTYGDKDKTGYTGASVTDHNELVSSLVKTYYLSDGKTKTTADNSGAASEGAAPKNAGDYKVVLSVPDSNETYEGKSAAIAFTIAQKTITIDWAADNFTYNKEDQTTSITASYKNVAGASRNLVVEVEKAFQDAGNYTATVSFDTGNDTGSKNYALPETVTKTYTMKPKPVKVTAVPVPEKTYDGTKKTPLCADESVSGATFSGLCEGDSLSLKGVTGEYASPNVSDAQTVNLNAYTEWTLDNDNYVLATTDQPTETTGKITAFNLANATVTLTTAEYNYTGSEIKPTPAVTFDAKGENAIPTADYTVSYENNTNVAASTLQTGAPTVTIAPADSNTNVTGSKSVKFTITKAQTLPDGTPTSFDVNAVTDSTLSLSNIGITLAGAKITKVEAVAGATGKVLSDKPSIINDGAAISWTTLESPSGTVNDQYTLTISTDNYEDFTVTVSFKGKIPVSISGLTKADAVYDGQSKTGVTGAAVCTANSTNVTSDCGTLVYTYYKDSVDDANKLEGAPTDAGKYQVVIAVPETNTTYIGSTTVEFTIAKADVEAPSLSDAITVNYADETFTPKSGYEVSTTSGDDFATGKLTGETAIDFTKTYYVRKVEDANHNASAQETFVPARPTTPGTPELVSKTDTTVVVTAVTGQEYSLNGTTWQDSNEFTGLTAGTAYAIYTRTKATTSTFASASSTAFSVTTKTAAVSAPSITPTVTATSVVLPTSGDPNIYEYSADGTNWQDGNAFTGLDPAKQYTYYVRVKGTDTAMPSQKATVTGYTNQSAPAKGMGYTISSYNEKGQPIISITSGYQVSTSPDFTSTISTNTALTVGETYYVRKAASGSIGASAGTAFVATEQPKVTVSATASDSKGGSVKVEGVTNGVCFVGTSVTLTATPNAGYKFVGWYDGETQKSTANPYTFNANDATILTAKFVVDKDKVETAPVSTARVYDESATTLGTLKGTHHYSLTSDPASIQNAGTYKLTAKLEDGYVWEDGTTADKTFFYTVNKQVTNDLPQNVSANGSGNGISGVTDAMEWRKSTDSAYQTGTGAEITNLDYGTYYIRVKGDANREAGKDVVIVLRSPVTTKAPTDITATTATLNGASGDTVTYQYRKAGSEDKWLTSNGNLTGLTADTEYEYRAVVNSAAGEIMTFRTEKQNPPTGSIQVHIKGTGSTDVTVAVEQGNTIISTKTGSIASGTMNASFTNLADGYYNLVVSTNDYTETRLLEVKNGAATQAKFDILTGTLNSVVEVKKDAPKVAVGGLADVITEADANAAAAGSKSVEVKLEVEKTPEANVEGGDQIKVLAGNQVVDTFLDMSLFKTTTEINGDNKTTTRENIGSEESNPVLEIVIPFNTNRNGLQIYHYHNGVAKKLAKLSERPTGSFTDGTYYIGDGYLFVYSKQFSTYAIGYEQEYSGGGSSYAVELPANIKNGKVEASPKNASTGSTVTITVTPDKGFTLETLTVLDKNGKEIEVKNLGNNKYSFKMPSGKVSISATFMEDNSMLNFFVDVKATDYYYDAVLWAAENDITKGTDAVHFSPNAPVTRAQVVTFLWRAAGKPVVNYAMSFADVSGDAYYTEAVRWAVSEGITNGVDETHFNPNATCTRAQIVTFLYRYAKAAASETTNPFTDVKQGAYYYDAVLWALANGITGGKTATTFAPSATCTRAQVVTFLYRYMSK